MNTWKKVPHAFFYLTLLIGLLAGVSISAVEQTPVKAAPMQAVLPGDVVISEFRTRGTGGLADEFVEIYNPKTYPANLGGLLVRTASSTGGAGATRYTFPSGVILQPGQYYIVTSSAYSGGVTETPPAVLSAAGISDNAGIAITLADGVTVIDAVGMSSGTIYKEGTFLTPLGSASNQSYERKPGGASDSCQDTVDNATDFSLLALNTPQASSTPRRLCGISSDFVLSQTVSTTTPPLGSKVTFTITVANNGPNNATGLTVRDALPLELVYFSDDSSGNYDSSTGIWTVGNLASGASAILNLVATVTTGGVTITNRAEVWSADQVDSDAIAGNSSVTEDDDADTTLTVVAPAVSLSITNAANNPNPSVGSNVVFAITVSNPAGNPYGATGVKVNAPFTAPLALEYISYSSTKGTYDGTDWTIGTLALGESASLYVTAKVASANPPPYVATASASGFLSSSATATIQNPLSGEADLRLTHEDLTVSSTTAGQVKLNLRLTNDGTDKATNVQVMDLLPEGLDYVSYISSLGTYGSSTGIWTVSELASGASATLSITVKVAESGTSTKNEAEVWRSDQYDTDSTPADGTGDDYTELEVPIADLNLSQTVSVAGGNAVFRITVRNDGPDDASNITIKNSSLAVNYTYVSHDATIGAYASGTGGWTIPILQEDQSAVLTVTTSYSTLLAVNWAQIFAVTEVDPDSLPGNCKDITSCIEDDDTGAPAADLSLSQSVDNPNPNPGNNVVFTITVSNAGIADTTGVQVKNTLPSGLTYVSSNQGTSYSASTGIWTIGTLPSGQSKTLTLTARVASHGIFTNYAEIWKSDQDDPDSKTGNNSTTEDDDTSVSVTSYRAILINEVAWGGTAASPDDEWIELYNPSAASINLTGWTLKSTSGSISVTLSGTVSAAGYFLLERGDNFTVSDTSASQLYSGALSDDGEILTLLDTSGLFIDTANGNGGAWPQGSALARYNFGSMERVGITAENDDDWIINVGTPKNGLDADGNPIYGTPKKVNSKGVEPTPTAVIQAAAIPPVGRPVINEFLPRPGFDWNQDGNVDVFDEFIEIKNIGTANINLSGWKLDDEADSGSNPFTLPALTLKPGEHAIFYGLQTNILLSDGGDTVRLLNTSNKVHDAYTYAIAEAEDQSICRLPDGNGQWYEDCVPTPNRLNSREGEVPTMPEGEGFESPVCDLPDTLHPDFLFAECHGYGANIWRSFFWDQFGWQGEQPIPENMNKLQSFVD